MKITKGFSAYLLCACLIAVFPCVVSLTHADTKEKAVPVLSIDKELKADRDAGKGNVAVDDAAKAKIQKAYGKLPLYFIRNNGQVDEKVKFYEKGSGHATFFTKEGVYLVLGGRLKAEGGRFKTQGEKLKAQGSRLEAKDTGLKAETRRNLQPPTSNLQSATRSASGESAEVDNSKLITNQPINQINELNSQFIRLFPLGANKDPEIIAEGQQAGKVNYFIGNDPEKWKTDIPTYRAVVYKEIYPGIDMKFYGSNRELEYDIIVSPGVDPSTVRLSYEGIESLRVTDEGELEIGLKACPEQGRGSCKIFQKRPYIYQVIAGKRVEVEGNFVTPNRESSLVEASKNTDTDNGHGQRSYGFQLASYNKDHPIVIDPVLVYSTYLGGSGFDYGYDIVVDDSGNVYLTGHTYSIDFPTQNPLQPNIAGSADVFVTKINPLGDALVYSTYLGGNDWDYGHGIAVDSSGNVYLSGNTMSSDFPTQNPLQPNNAGSADAFVTKINPTGDALVYSTYLGGSNVDHGYDIAVDSSGNAYLTGYTYSSDFPIQNPLQPNNAGERDAFVTKINPLGDALVYSTYLGGSGYDRSSGIAVDGSGNAYLTGDTRSTDFPTQNPLQVDNAGSGDAFVTKINPTGDALVYSTYLGGSDQDSGYDIAVDDSGNVYLTGEIESTDFPTQNPLQQNIAGVIDAFVTKINPTGDALVYSTYLGGRNIDRGYGIAADSSGNAYLIGNTASTDFPTADFIQSYNAGGMDVFVTKINPTGDALVYSTYLGGSNYEYGWGGGIAIDSSANVYLTGATGSIDFPTQNPLQSDYAGSYDIFVTKIFELISTPSFTFTVTVTPGGSILPSTATPVGSILPSGDVIVSEGVDITFIITNYTGYDMVDVLVDGVSAGPVSTYTFENITSDHTISAIFIPVIPAGVTLEVDLPKTGQTISYAPGDDGDIQAGVEWPAPRFTDNGDGTLTDNLTGLGWLQDANCIQSQYSGFGLNGLAIWHRALDFVAGINSGTYPNCGAGYNDWRLPNINEIESLLNTGEGDQRAWLSGQGFTNVSGNYWSASTNALWTSSAWSVDMLWGGGVWTSSKYGARGYLGLLVWPVRAGQLNTPDPAYPANIWKTGQTISYAAGDDGDIQAGVHWPIPRFTTIYCNASGPCADQGSDCDSNASTDVVIHNLTGLMWARDGDLDWIKPWADALTYTNGMSLCGSTDWRLPNRKELSSLIDRSQNDPALPGEHLFINVQSEHYWSSSEFAYPSQYSEVWYVDMRNGDVRGDLKQDSNYVWPVRSGIVSSIITATATTGGSISPSGNIIVGYGADQTFTVANYTGYDIGDVLVDGVSAGPVSTYTFYNVTVNHTIEATFTCIDIDADNDADGYPACAGDCDDTDPAINPGAVEICDDTLDNDCDGLIDTADIDCIAGLSAISAQEAHDRAAAGDGVIIDVRTVEEHNACNPAWLGVICPTAEPENRGSPQWIDTATGVMMQAVNMPFWIRSTGSDTQPQNPTIFEAFVQYSLDNGLLSTDTPVYLICRSGYRSYWAGVWLVANLGLTNVYTIDSDGDYSDGAGGMLEWYADSLPIHFDNVQNRGWHGPMAASVLPADGYTETVSNTVTFTVGILEPPWGNSGWTHFDVTRVSLYINGAEAAFSTDDTTELGGQEYTFTVDLPNGIHTWNVRAENLTTTNNVPEVSWNPYADAPGPGDRTITVCVDIPFTDVPSGHWAEDYINAIACKGITTGYGDGTYRPTNIVTRAETAAFIIRAVEGEPAADYCGTTDPFPDVPYGDWACKYIKRLVELGISTGYGDGTYRPTNTVTRAETAAFIIRAVEGEPAADYCGTTDPCPDVPYGDWACKYIKRLVELSITTGCGGGNYCPGDNTTRAQMAAFLARAFLGMP